MIQAQTQVNKSKSLGSFEQGGRVSATGPPQLHPRSTCLPIFGLVRRSQAKPRMRRQEPPTLSFNIAILRHIAPSATYYGIKPMHFDSSLVYKVLNTL